MHSFSNHVQLLPPRSRLNRTMNQEVGQHPGFFLFMNRMRTSIFENGHGIVLQANAGKPEKPTVASIAAKKLLEKAAKAEEQYANGEITPAQLLSLVAKHYDDDKTIEAFDALNEADELNSQHSSQDPDVDAELVLSEDEVQIIEDDGENTTDWMNDNWTTSTWPTPAQATSPEVDEATEDPLPDGKVTNPAQIAAQLRHLTRHIEVMDLVDIICAVCLEYKPTFDVNIACGHAICTDCFLEPNLKQCPLCRARLGRSTPLQINSLKMAWKEEIRNGYGTANLQQNHDQDGNRPADTTWTQRLNEESEALARELQQQGES